MLKEFIEKNKGRNTFLEHEVKGLLKAMGMSVPEGVFIGKKDIIPSPMPLNFPLVVKVSSLRIASKSDVKGVRLGIRDENELKDTVYEFMKIENAEGVLVEEMAAQGVEVIVGGAVDKQFGPVVMFGIGGVFVELFKDVAFGLVPMTTDDAQWLIRQVKGYRLLEGYRGKPAADIDGLVNMIVSISEMMASNLIEEIDLNPIALYPKGAIVLDAKMKIIS
ncbi:MAG: acetate--CoA ligase family protein [Thermodesulfovibrionales bacterium]|nr:acetate--CoA ligase family protein [Thermodesulfovibrionales bacterium]